MKTKLKLALLCLVLSNFSLFAQQSTRENEPRVTITKKITEEDGTSISETIVKKGQAARDFDIDAYVKANKGDNVDLDIRSEGGDEERYISIQGSEVPRNFRYKSVEDEVVREVERTVNWVNDQVRSIEVKTGSTSKGFLGVDEDADEKEEEEGLVVEVIRNSAADQAGLRDNDVILSLNGTKVNQWSDLTRFMQTAKKGDLVKIVYRRNGEEATTEAILTTRADVKPVDCTQEQPRGFLGVSDISGDDDENTQGVKVAVIKKSAAEKAGLKNGDVILRLNETEIEDFEDVEDFMEYIHPGDKIKINYLRDGKTNVIEVTAGKEGSWDWGQVDLKQSDINIRTKDACLGVYNGTVTASGARRGASIVNFTVNSPAKKAGLKEGDVILSIAGIRVQDCEELWDALSRFKPNDKVKVEYVREDKELQAEVALGTCTDASSMVKIVDADENGDSSERQFFSWNIAPGDEASLRETQTITIHKADQGDIPVINATSGNESNPVMRERSLQLQRVKVSPNPSNGPLKVEFNAPAEPTTVTLYDLSGRQLFQEELNIFRGKYVQQFDLSEFIKSGVLLRIQQGDKFYSEQILVN